MIQRKQILQQTGIFFKQNPGEKHLTLQELRDMISNNQSNLLMTKLSRYITNITGSDAYWFKAKEDLKAIIQHVGPPTFFFTFSSADMHWPQLHDLFQNTCNVNGDCNAPDVRHQNVIDNPHIVDWFYTERLKSFIKHWLYNTLDAKWHWYRFEYQSRGSIHCHGVAKLNNDPGLCKLSETSLKGYLADVSEDESTPDSLAIVNGKIAGENICRYYDWILSTCNPDPPDEGNWIKPIIHPCQKNYNDIEESDSDYIDLLNMVQRHTRCSTSYCSRKRGNEKELKCSFNFPFEHHEKTSLQFELIHTKDSTPKYKMQVVTKRNDSRVNNHQHLQASASRLACKL